MHYRGTRRRKGENLSEEKIAENLSNLGKETDIQAQKTQRVPNKMNPKISTPRHTVIKMVKIKDEERLLKAEREEQPVTYKVTPVRLSADFSA